MGLSIISPYVVISWKFIWYTEEIDFYIGLLHNSLIFEFRLKESELATDNRKRDFEQVSFKTSITYQTTNIVKQKLIEKLGFNCSFLYTPCTEIAETYFKLISTDTMTPY